MKDLSDQQILSELQNRFAEKNRLLTEQQELLAKLKSVNERLIDAEKQKSMFLSNIKNEVNNPMTSILGLLKHNLDGKLSDKQRMQNTKMVFEEASSLNFQLQNLFMASELESGDCHLANARIDVVQLVEDVVNELRDQSLRVDNFVLTNKANDTWLYTDKNKLFVIISNLLSNAFKFGKDRHVSVTIEKNTDNRTVITVSDLGQGMSPDEISRIFDRFSQLDSGTTKSYGGHGLGLSIVHPLVELLGGEISIESRIGQGTTVEISISEIQSDDNTELFDEADSNLFLLDDANDEVF